MLTASGQKYWRYRFRIDGKPSMYTIDEYPAVGAAEARKLLTEARALVERGINPNLQKKSAAGTTRANLS